MTAPEPARPQWRRKFSTEDIVALMELRVSQNEAARRLGVCQGSIRARLAKEGLVWPQVVRKKRLDDETFTRLWRCRSITTEEIARHLGVTRQAISFRARALCLEARGRDYVSKIEAGLFTELWQAGVSVEEICGHFGIASRSAVSARARRLGLPPRERAAGAGSGGWRSITLAQFTEAKLARLMAADARRAREAHSARTKR